MDHVLKDLPAILAVTFIFGGWVIYAVVNSLATNWRTARVTEQNAVLKRAMLDKGFTADEIERVIRAGVEPEATVDAVS